MAIILGSLKCCFCKYKNGILKSVHSYGIYGEAGKRIFFHDECLQSVEMEPEKFGHAMVDMALHIHYLQEENLKKTNAHIVDHFKKSVEKLQQKNFERLLPKK